MCSSDLFAVNVYILFYIKSDDDGSEDGRHNESILVGIHWTGADAIEVQFVLNNSRILPSRVQRSRNTFFRSEMKGLFK